MRTICIDIIWDTKLNEERKEQLSFVLKNRKITYSQVLLNAQTVSSGAGAPPGEELCDDRKESDLIFVDKFFKRLLNSF